MEDVKRKEKISYGKDKLVLDEAVLFYIVVFAYICHISGATFNHHNNVYILEFLLSICGHTLLLIYSYDVISESMINKCHADRRKI